MQASSSSLTDKIIVVFGGTGFVGSSVVHVLAKKGYRVRVATRSGSRTLSLKTAGLVGQVEPIITDIRSRESLLRVLEGAHGFVNTVGCLFEKKRGDFEALHAKFPRLLAQCASQQGCEVGVHVSAIGAQADHPSAYARTKAEGEQAIWAGMPKAMIVRPSLVFGPKDLFFNGYASLSRVLPVLPIVSTAARFQPVYVADLAAGIVALLENPTRYGGQIFECGGPSVYTFPEMLRSLLTLINRPKKLLLPVPYALVLVGAKLIGWLPYAPVTPDQIYLLKNDNVVSEAAIKEHRLLSDLGISVHAFEDVAPLWLSGNKPGGEYNKTIC